MPVRAGWRQTGGRLEAGWRHVQSEAPREASLRLRRKPVAGPRHRSAEITPQRKNNDPSLYFGHVCYWIVIPKKLIHGPSATVADPLGHCLWPTSSATVAEPLGHSGRPPRRISSAIVTDPLGHRGRATRPLRPLGHCGRSPRPLCFTRTSMAARSEAARAHSAREQAGGSNQCKKLAAP